MATANLSPAQKAKLKREILVDVALWFAADCPDTMNTETRREFMRLFDKSTGAAIDNNTIKSYDAADETYLRRQIRTIARKVYNQTTPGRAVSMRTLKDVFDKFVADEQLRALSEGREGTIFCAVYTP